MIEDDRPIRICPKCGSIITARRSDECNTCDLEWDKLILTNYTFKIRLEMDKEQRENGKKCFVNDMFFLQTIHTTIKKHGIEEKTLNFKYSFKKIIGRKTQ